MISQTPMMKQWYFLKQKAKDALLFFRLGDFYEAFVEDAVLISKELNLTLTKRQNIQMCGVPHHAAENYIDKLIAKGYKVAIAEQMEDPKSVKGIVKRDIVRILSPATVTNSSLLDEKSNNYFVSIDQVNKTFGISIIDITTSEFSTLEVESEKDFLNEILKIRPKEILVSNKFNTKSSSIIEKLKFEIKFLLTIKEDYYFDFDMSYEKLLSHFKIATLDSFGLKSMSSCINASGALLTYLTDDLSMNLDQIKALKRENLSSYMSLDYFTLKNLEIFESENSNTENSLLNLLDKTKTAMGARLLKYFLKFPLLNILEIEKRQNSIEEFLQNFDIFYSLQENLDNIRDLQRILIRIINKSAHPRDFALLRYSLRSVPNIKDTLKNLTSSLILEDKNNLKDVYKILDILENSLVENPPLRISDGEIFKDGYNKELDDLREISKNSTKWIENYQKTLREETKIKNLKIGYTRAFGYYIDVNRSKSELVPEGFIRKQTLVNNERYITIKLKEFEEKALLAEEKIKNLENTLYLELREEILKYSNDIEQISNAIARIDVLFSFSKVAKANNYIKPKIENSKVLNIKSGRHPIIEQTSALNEFIPNDTCMDTQNQLFLITGPNMAGKSTYIRQVALISIMAQLGSYVPAKEAVIGIIDKVFSRIGASDDLSRGQSTFMVEMAQTANILNNTTDRSLVILDEIGRGTSTYDGISIAWAVAEYLVTTEDKKAKTLFATHYSELTEMENHFNIKNYNIQVKEIENSIIFLRKIVKGGTDKSYGIHVAKLAGLPNAVINTAIKRLKLLENPKKAKKQKVKEPTLFDDFNNKNVIKEIEDIDVNNISPIKALEKLYELKQKIIK